MVLYLCDEEHTIKFHSPITGLLLLIVALIFVYDSNRITIEPNKFPVVELVFPPMQESVDTWERGIIVTGGDFKPPK